MADSKFQNPRLKQALISKQENNPGTCLAALPRLRPEAAARQAINELFYLFEFFYFES